MPGNRDASHLVNPNPGHCRNCGVDVEFPRQYCDEHRPAAKPHKKRGASERARENVQATPVKVAGDIGAASGRTSGTGSGQKRAPTVDQTSKVLGRILLYISLLVAVRLVTGDPALVTEEQREAQVKELQLDDDQAHDIMHPLARFITPTTLWKTWGRHVIDNSDVIDSIAALYDYFSGLGRYARSRQASPSEQPRSVPARLAPSAPPQASNGSVPAYEPPHGVVVTREMLQKGEP